MKRPALFFGPDGSRLREDSPELLEMLGDPDPDYDVARFLVVNMGFVKLAALEPAAEITLRSETAAPKALRAVEEMLSGLSVPFVRFRSLDDGNEAEAVVTRREALLRISALQPELGNPDARI